MPKFFLIKILFICLTLKAEAQFKSATLGIDGLTCSMCSNGVERLIRQLDFVSDVKMDLNTTTAEVTFYPDKAVSIEALSKKVFDAGYSVRSLQAVFHFENEVVANEGSNFIYEGNEYVFVKSSGEKLLADSKIKFIGKNFISKKELPAWKTILAKFKAPEKGKSKVYYIAL